jgi:putative endonuclease
LKAILKGTIGEERAVSFLVKSGHEILSRNYRSRYGEIDIVCQSNSGIIIFCEIKNYKKHAMVSPVEKVANGQINRLRRVGEIYLSRTKRSFSGARIDIILVENNIVVDLVRNV